MRISFVSAMFVVGCGDLGPSPARPSVEVTQAYLVDHGNTVRGAITAYVTAPAEGGSIALWAGARATGPVARPCRVDGRRPCPPPPGWFLDLPEDAQRVELGPGETRAIRIAVRSGNRPATAPSAHLARCGEPVTVFLVPENDGAQGGAFETTYQCAIAALRRR